jgi:hypothetical protein
MGVLTLNTLKSTDLGAIDPVLVTWVEEKSLRESNIALFATRVTKLIRVSQHLMP